MVDVSSSWLDSTLVTLDQWLRSCMGAPVKELTGMNKQEFIWNVDSHPPGIGAKPSLNAATLQQHHNR